MADHEPIGRAPAAGAAGLHAREEQTRTRRSPLRFVLLLFVISLPFWLLGALAGRSHPQGVPLNLPLSSLMAINPLIVASILVFRESGASGVTGLLRRIVDVRRISKKRWYVPIFLLMPFIYATSYLLLILIGRPLPDPQVPFRLAPVFFVTFFLAALGEEVGWSGYALDPLQERTGALGAGLLLGIVWATWHVVPDLQGHHAPSWIFWQRLYSVALRVLIVWLYNNTGGSLFAAVTFHAMDNVSWALFPNYGSSYDPSITCVITTITAATVVFLWRPETLARFRYA